jgi:hypothetical protein
MKAALSRSVGSRRFDVTAANKEHLDGDCRAGRARGVGGAGLSQPVTVAASKAAYKT